MGLTPLSFDRKLTLQVDTGADANAINKKTFNEVFPDVELEESTYMLQNFDKRLKGLFVRECAEGSRCSRKTLCVCVWGKVLASSERGFQE